MIQMPELSPAVELWSVREAMAALRAGLGRAGFEQSSYLAEAGVFGERFVRGSHTFVRREDVETLVRRPLYDLKTLATAPSLAGMAGALILRQRPLTPEPDPTTATRPFFGIHADIADTADPDLRRDVDDSIREYWGISAARRAAIESHIATFGFCPLLVTIGKWCLTGRDIVALAVCPEDGYAPGRVSLTVRPPGDWLADLRRCWVDSGSGPSAIWWSRQA